MSPSKPTTFWRYTQLVLRCSVRDFNLLSDMAIGLGLSIATVGLEVWWQLIPTEDWQVHKWKWIASAALPFVAVAAFHIAYRIATAPWRVHQDQVAAHGEALGLAVRESTRLRDSLNDYLEGNDAPPIVLRWDIRKEQKEHPGMFGMTKMADYFLHIDNRSTDEDVFNVQIEDAFLTETARASFGPINVLLRGQSVCVEPKFNLDLGDHAHELGMVIYASGVVQWSELSAEKYYRDERKHDHVRVPLSVRFDKYGGKRFLAKFYFDLDLHFERECIQFVEVKAIRPRL